MNAHSLLNITSKWSVNLLYSKCNDRFEIAKFAILDPSQTCSVLDQKSLILFPKILFPSAKMIFLYILIEKNEKIWKKIFLIFPPPPPHPTTPINRVWGGISKIAPMSQNKMSYGTSIPNLRQFGQVVSSGTMVGLKNGVHTFYSKETCNI